MNNVQKTVGIERTIGGEFLFRGTVQIAGEHFQAAIVTAADDKETVKGRLKTMLEEAKKQLSSLDAVVENL